MLDNVSAAVTGDLATFLVVLGLFGATFLGSVFSPSRKGKYASIAACICSGVVLLASCAAYLENITDPISKYLAG